MTEKTVEKAVTAAATTIIGGAAAVVIAGSIGTIGGIAVDGSIRESGRTIWEARGSTIMVGVLVVRSGGGIVGGAAVAVSPVTIHASMSEN